MSILTNFNTRIVTAIATAAVVLGAVAPAAFADTTVSVSGNGAGSNNTVVTSNTSGTKIVQKNTSTVVTSVNSTASTGGNNASYNTGGDTSINTGNANSKVKVDVGGSSNAAVVTDPNANTTTNVDVSGNGAGSSNGVVVTNSSWFTAIQNNWSSIVTAITSVSKTGKNTSSFNTGGTTNTTTGNGSSSVTVHVTGSNNTLVQ